VLEAFNIRAFERGAPAFTFAAALMLALMATGASAARQPTASIVIDANTGKTLHAHAADERRFPASLTKMMTIYLVFEALQQRRIKARDRITFSDYAAAQPPSKLGLEPGETISVDNAVRALITKSANDVATALAEYMAGSEKAFASLMTRKARALGMRDTYFRNASGLPDPMQVTTARDMATLGLALQDHFPRRFKLFSLRHFAFRKRRYSNHNRLLGRFRGTDGIKTGYTRASGFNITTNVRRDGKHLVGVVIGQKSGRQRNAVMRRLLSRALSRASTRRTRRLRRPVSAPRLIARPRLVPRPYQAKRGQRTKLAKVLGAYRPAARRPMQRAAARKITTIRQPALPRSIQSTHQVQVGAFLSDTEARQALVAVSAQAGPLLRGYQPISLKARSNARTIYRARFAGFDGAGAIETCANLKSVRVDCFVTRVN